MVEGFSRWEALSCRDDSALSDYPANKKPYTSGHAFIEYIIACSVDILQEVGSTARTLATENL
jgi:hypothetical protein